MAAIPLDAVERARLCDLFDELGPDAPTLCEGWSTADLAAHLLVRERNPLAAPGLLFGGPFARYTEKSMERAKSKGYEWLVDRVRSGPPLPWRVPGVRDWVNINEFFVHHEDVRRANGRGPRDDIPDLEDALWRMLKSGARMQLRHVKGAGVELARPGDDAAITAKKGSPVVRITGTPAELVLYLNGRKYAAQVELDGPTDAVASVASAPMGV